MPSTKRYAAWALVALGVLAAAVVPQIVEESASQELMLALSVAGGLLLVAGALRDEVLRRAEGAVDERYAAIHYRSGWYAFWLVMGVTWTLAFAVTNADLSPPSLTVPGIAAAGTAVYVGGCAWFGRVM